jgi:hypothetical protein
VERLCSHWPDFREIVYLKSFKKSVKNIQISGLSTGVQSKNDGDVTINILEETIIHYSNSLSDKFGTLGLEP